VSTDISAIVAFILAASSPQELVERFQASARNNPQHIFEIHKNVYSHVKNALDEINSKLPPPSVRTYDAPEYCTHARIGDMVRDTYGLRKGRIGFVCAYVIERDGVAFPYIIDWFDGQSGETHHSFVVIS
jgi:hypothetical protein